MTKRSDHDLWAHPPSLMDPDLGTLIYRHVVFAPAWSYWQADWIFPPTGTRVFVDLPGNIDGPRPAVRQFYLALLERSEDVVTAVRPVLDQVFREWLGRGIHQDIWQDVTIHDVAVGYAEAREVAWWVRFETTGSKWLGVTIPFIGDSPQAPEIYIMVTTQVGDHQLSLCHRQTRGGEWAPQTAAPTP